MPSPSWPPNRTTIRRLRAPPNEKVGYGGGMANERNATPDSAPNSSTRSRRRDRSPAAGRTPSRDRSDDGSRSSLPGRRGRSTPADDPLAPERTRWLRDAVGGNAALARLLGVSASQTSRWAAGQERPGAGTAPLLIDVEHVFARARIVWGEPAASTWMTSANAHLGGARPIDVVRLQGPGPVLAALDAAAWGGAA